MWDWCTIWRPAVYHGRGKTSNFFEGWYYKVVDAAERHVHAIIPGVFLGPRGDRAASHCFVQTLDGATGHSTYQRYPLSEFHAASGDLDLRVGPNRFRSDRITLDIDTPERILRGELAFSGVTPWPVRPLAPGVMGPYALAPFMECYHGVLSFDHRVDGRLVIDGEQVDFDGGHGYIEKDWGQAFPRAWIWMQSNHFGSPGTCLTASVASIPWLRTRFAGFIVGLWHAGRLYRFATYTGARIERLELSDDRVFWRLSGHGLGRRGPQHLLELTAHRAGGGLLHAPSRTAMLQRVVESLTATVSVRLLAAGTSGGERLFEGTGRHAGLEINGELSEITGG